MQIAARGIKNFSISTRCLINQIVGYGFRYRFRSNIVFSRRNELINNAIDMLGEKHGYAAEEFAWLSVCSSFINSMVVQN